jgi:hypothetical protein
MENNKNYFCRLTDVSVLVSETASGWEIKFSFIIDPSLDFIICQQIPSD